MMFNFLETIFAVSPALDQVEHEISGVTVCHGKRVAAIAAAMGDLSGMMQGELQELMMCALLHDCGLTQYVQTQYRGSYRAASEHFENPGMHCSIGEELLKNVPVRKNLQGAVLCHHERADGKGPFEKEPQQTLPAARWIHLADQLDLAFDLSIVTQDKYEMIMEYLLSQQGSLFDEASIRLFQDAFPFEQMTSLRNEKVDLFLASLAPSRMQECTPEQLMQFAKVFALISDHHSRYTRLHSVGVADKAYIMAIYYGASQELAARIYTAGALHDIGTLVIDRDVLEKPEKLTHREYQYVQSHVYEIYRMLASAQGLADITRWASRHHEKLDGSGYPFGLQAAQLDQWDRLIACLDIYQALLENRSYKKSVSHASAMEKLTEMAQAGLLDHKICEDIGNIFQN